MKTYFLNEIQAYWISENLKGYSEHINFLTEKIYVRDNEGMMFGLMEFYFFEEDGDTLLKSRCCVSSEGVVWDEVSNLQLVGIAKEIIERNPLTLRNTIQAFERTEYFVETYGKWTEAKSVSSVSPSTITIVCCSHNTDAHMYALCLNKAYKYDELIGFDMRIKQTITLDVLIQMWMREDIRHCRWLFVKDNDITMVNYLTKGDIETLVYFTLNRSEEYNIVHIRFVNVRYSYETRKMLNDLREISGYIEDNIHKEITYMVDEVSQGTYHCSEYRNYQEFVDAHIIE